MGWTTLRIDCSPSEWFRKEYNNDHFKVIDVAIVHRTELYAAVKEIPTGKVICFIFRLGYMSRDYHNFSYKDMTEFAGPFMYRCPKRIFSLLTTLEDTADNERAIDWRKSVSAYHERLATINSGGIFRTKNPLHFNNGTHYEYFYKTSGSRYVAGILNADGDFVPLDKVVVRDMQSRL